MDGVACAIAHHLHLDVTRLLKIFLDVDRVVAKGRSGLGARRRQRLGEVVLGARDLHAAPAAAGRCLDEDGIADVGGDAARLAVFGHRAVGPRHDRDAEPLGGPLGLDLVSHDADMLRRRADEGDVVRLEDLGELGVLGQEAVAGMDRVGTGDLAGGDDLVDVEIAVAGGRRADAHAFVGEPHMHGVGIGGRVDRDGLDAELLAGAQHPQRDLAAVGDEDLVKHRSPRPIR